MNFSVLNFGRSGHPSLAHDVFTSQPVPIFKDFDDPGEHWIDPGTGSENKSLLIKLLFSATAVHKANCQLTALKTTVRRYLSTLAIRANDTFEIEVDSLAGIDFDSTQVGRVSSIKGVGVHLLNMCMTGHSEYLNA
ncbi:uncharacterized protein N7483_000047 [Penicillium malachiteum]|uniref:uncharacterized protein n=1 Tax=Penicillium malachiteum TaxID=1324776 RepID=UPI002548DA43|nr:uncharacterized protein N7483_000047 [Penicillium malachiteum]KAJ5734922.1 hypothetical protein N7483_000047 [Penicillium malachiteum]